MTSNYEGLVKRVADLYNFLNKNEGTVKWWVFLNIEDKGGTKSTTVKVQTLKTMPSDFRKLLDKSFKAWGRQNKKKVVRIWATDTAAIYNVTKL